MFLNSVNVDKSNKNSTRKLPFIPRIGLSVEVGKYQVDIKTAPITEALLSIKDKAMSLGALKDLAAQKLSTIRMPKWSKKAKAEPAKPAKDKK